MTSRPVEYKVGSPVEPRSYDHVAVRPLGGGSVRLEGGFWGERQELNRDVTIPHGTEMLEQWGSLDNLRAAAAGADQGYRLPLFMDSDVYKVLEAIAWERQHGPVRAQERFFAETVGLLAAAQQPDGYLNSHVQVAQSGKRFADPAMGHELYCAGHMFQAAVAESRSGEPLAGPVSLGDVAGRFAGYLLAALPAMPAYLDGHAEVEMALVELYRDKGDEAYLALAEDLIARRGKARLNYPGGFHPDYFQDDIPVTDAKAIRGHAVRALYLLSGVTDAYIETGRRELLVSCLAQWDDMVGGKAYLTGGLGSRHEGEAFGERFELPSDRAYCETCAAIASIMWNWRMTLATGDGRYADLLERTLYNGFLSGWGLDGKTFFYVNPLRGGYGTTRQGWYRVACCPPNLMRLIASLEHYVATRTPDGLQIHQFMAATVEAELGGGCLRGNLLTEYPHKGLVSFLVLEAPDGPVEISFRVPSWSPEAVLAVNGSTLDGAGATGITSHGYLRARGTWQPGDEISIELAMGPRVVRPDARIDSLRGCFALERGPFVYCFESFGGGAQAGPSTRALDGVYGVPGEGVSELPDKILAEDIVGLVVPAGERQPYLARGWPYLQAGDGNGDGDGNGKGEGRMGVAPLKAVPYYTWCNRGPSEMRVWLPELGAAATE